MVFGIKDYLMIDKDKTLAQSLMEGNLQSLLEEHKDE